VLHHLLLQWRRPCPSLAAVNHHSGLREANNRWNQIHGKGQTGTHHHNYFDTHLLSQSLASPMMHQDISSNNHRNDVTMALRRAYTPSPQSPVEVGHRLRTRLIQRRLKHPRPRSPTQRTIHSSPLQDILHLCKSHGRRPPLRSSTRPHSVHL
jgi:hypothetical protein